MPEKPQNFWQELKRRKVIRVIIVYAAAAYVILELVSIIAEPFGLPDWTLKLVFVLLCVGLVITVTLSWIYDITPEGVQKTKPVRKGQLVDKPAGSNGWKIATYVSVAVIIGLLTISIFSIGRKSEGLDKSIAVLQFENLGSDEEQEWFSEGITDIIINQLSKIKEFRVLGRTSTLKYKKGEKTITEIGRELNVNLIIEGTVQRVSDKVRISIQLVRVLNEDHLWSEIYDRDWEDIFSIQNDIALSVARELKTALSENEKDKLKKNSTSSSEAYDLYLEGRYYWNMRTEEGVRQSMELFEKAVAIDSNFALAYSGLADAYHIAADWNFLDHDSADKKATLFAFHSILIDNNLAEPYAALGNIVQQLGFDIELAELMFKRSLQINPNYSSANQWYALFLSRTGRFEEAINYMEIALQLDPESAIINYASGLVYYFAEEYDQALIQLEHANRIDQNFVSEYYPLACNLHKGQFTEVISEYEKTLDGIATKEEFSQNATRILNSEGADALMDYIIISELRKENPHRLLLPALYTFIGDHTSAIDILESNVQERYPDYLHIGTDPAYRKLRSEPRFIALCRNINLLDI